MYPVMALSVDKILTAGFDLGLLDRRAVKDGSRAEDPKVLMANVGNSSLDGRVARLLQLHIEGRGRPVNQGWRGGRDGDKSGKSRDQLHGDK